MTQILQMQFAVNREELRQIEAELARLGTVEGWDSVLTYQINLALEELAMNTASYGYPEGRGFEEGQIDVRILRQGSELKIEYSDNGIAFDPFREAPDPDTSTSLSERRVGGLGIHFVRTMMDEVAYRRADGRNQITLIKRKRP